MAKATKKMTPAAREKREERIVAAIRAGKLSYRQIAEKYSVSLPTVNNKAKKFGISRGRRKGAKVLVAGPRSGRTATKASTARSATKRTTRRTATSRTSASRTPARSSGRKGQFGSAFRELVLAHYPNISLRDFEKLSTMVEKVVG